MVLKTVVAGAWPVLGAAAVACALFAGSAAAKDVTVALDVSARGIDLSQPAGAHQMYARLRHVAWLVCTHGMRVDLQPAPNPAACRERALADAVRSVNLPLLTQVYLETHSLGEAQSHGIDVPMQVATK